MLTSASNSGTVSSMTNRRDDEEDDDTLYDEARIEWINLIFLPFNPIFQNIVLVCVLHKVVIGPMVAVFGLTNNCHNAMDYNVLTKISKAIYKYAATIIYFVDTFLHIVHRQVTDKAVKREHLPKSALLIILDILALIPFYDLMAEDLCSVQFWPNILCFVEFIIVYRIVQYFEIIKTHHCWKQYVGLTILIFTLVSCVTCFLLLLTFHGLCANCNIKKTFQNIEVYYDWRHYINMENQTKSNSKDFLLYFYGFQYIMRYVTGIACHYTRPSALAEYGLACVFMYCGYMLNQMVIFPKLFAESLLSLRRICGFDPRIQKIICEIKRRNPSPTAYLSVKNFYDLLWKQRAGITCSPDMLSQLPRYLRLNIREDLVWPIFYHSPTFRKATIPFKRYISEYIQYDYKLPGEKLYAGPHCQSNMYYLKRGIVQLLSCDDGITPILSVTAGTLFGDTSFYCPPLRRKITVKCLNYCEVLYVSRGDLLKALHRYAIDRKTVFDLAREKIKHARDLYDCKQKVKGIDRVEDEGMDWIKKRWWEISDCVESYRRRGKKVSDGCELPAEETSYHCAKYIGQLMLTTEVQLKQSSLFVNDQFPWILAPNSTLYRVWRNFVTAIVIFVLIYFPPNITMQNVSVTFTKYKYFVDFVYISDICMSLFTAVSAEEFASSTFSSVMLVRFKKPAFVMDILATVWIEEIAKMVEKPQYYYPCLFNRLLKIHMLFPSEGSTWKLGQDYMFAVYTRIFFVYFSFMYVSAFLLFFLIRFVPGISAFYFFGPTICDDAKQVERDCLLQFNAIRVPIEYLYTFVFSDYPKGNVIDITIKMLLAFFAHIMCKHLKTRCIASMYLKLRDAVSYQKFVTTLKNYYCNHNIHKDLMIRLNRFLLCHWKYHHGVDIMLPDSLKNEPYDVFWKSQGEIAEKIIKDSKVFMDADPAVVKELAYIAKFQLMPKDSIIFVLGVTCSSITWIVQGHVKVEYYDDEGTLQTGVYSNCDMLSVTASLLEKPSLRTYTAETDCEILHISLSDIKHVLQRHPHELENLKNVIKEFAPQFDEIYYNYLRKHVDYHRKILQRLTGRRYSALPHSSAQSRVPLMKRARKKRNMIPIDITALYISPDSSFMTYWMPFRALTVMLAIIASSLQGGGGVYIRWYLSLGNTLFTGISVIDITLKIFLAYYDERGILITAKLKTISHYLTRTFLMDLLGTLPWESIVPIVITENVPEGYLKLVGTISNFAHLYIFTGYFDYLADRPSATSALIKIAKWQIVIILIMLAFSHLLINLCADFAFDGDGILVNMTRLDTCWMPNYQKLEKHPPLHQLQLIFAQSLNLAQSALLNTNHAFFEITKKDKVMVAVTLVVLGIIYWYVLAFSLSVLLLVSRSNALPLQGLNQLNSFLKSELVEPEIIENIMAHFNYWTIRTSGINIQTLMFERVGVVFRQDLSYFLYKSTLIALDTLFEGGDQFQRQVASHSTEMYFRPREEIMREMDIINNVYVVHRGKVVIMQEDEKMAILTKGCIFGQLTGRMPKPVRVTAIADGYADVLAITVNNFHDVLNDELRSAITNHHQSKNDFMSTKKVFKEAPRDSIQYILRGRKTIKLPSMLGPVEARRGNWYYLWLYVAWMLAPTVTTYCTGLLSIIPPKRSAELFKYVYIFIALDIVHVIHMVLEYFTMEVIVVGDRCVKRKVGWRLLKDWRLYVNLASVVIPMITYITKNWYFLIARLLRLAMFYDFYKHFCGIKSNWSPILFKTIVLLLLGHCMTCGWVSIGCRHTLPVPQPELTQDQKDLVTAITDYDEWVPAAKYRPSGCTRPTDYNFFLVPRKWFYDYKIALTFIVQMQTNTGLGDTTQMTVLEIYYKVFINILLYLVDIWLMRAAINFMCSKFRELYHYDYNVKNLGIYLRTSGLAPSLMRSVVEYTNLLWQRQRGNWMPELALHAPQCLKEDIFCALYLYHILTPPLFRELPEYFTRQLVARVIRLVIFPGKSIVEEGDIYPVMYFIHEGEIEKWYNYNSPERKLVSLLSTNGYFGFIPGLFPNTRYQFTFVSRTVVDLLSLRLHDWQDLLTAYPDIKMQLYKGAKQQLKMYKR